MTLTKVNSVRRNLQITVLNTSILTFFAEITNFLLTVKIAHYTSILQKSWDEELFIRLLASREVTSY